jgi:hypothetical protein
MFDRLRDWYDNLGTRERRIFGLGSIVLVLSLGLWVVLQVMDGLSALAAKNEAMQNALTTLETKREQLLEDKGKQADAVGQIGAEAIALATYLEKVGGEIGVTIRSQTDRAPATKGKFNELAKEIVLMDVTLDQLAQFLKRTESNPVVVSQKLMVKRSMVNKDKMDRVTITFATYERGTAARGSGRDAGTP